MQVELLMITNAKIRMQILQELPSTITGLVETKKQQFSKLLNSIKLSQTYIVTEYITKQFLDLI